MKKLQHALNKLNKDILRIGMNRNLTKQNIMKNDYVKITVKKQDVFIIPTDIEEVDHIIYLLVRLTCVLSFKKYAHGMLPKVKYD